MQWRLILEEYSFDLIYIQGSKNIAADTLSIFDIVDTPNPVRNKIIKSTKKHYGLEDKDISQPTNFTRNQQIDMDLINIAHSNKDYSMKNFHEADKKYYLICKNRKIMIPKQLE